MRKVMFQKRTLIIIITGAVVTFLIFLYTTFFVQKQNLVSPDLNIFDKGSTSFVGVSTLTPLSQITNTVNGDVSTVDWRSDGVIALAYKSGIVQVRDHNYNVERTIDSFTLSLPSGGVHTYTGLSIEDILWSPAVGDNRLALAIGGLYSTKGSLSNDGGAVVIMDASTGVVLKTFVAPSPNIDLQGQPPRYTYIVRWSPDGQYIGAVSSDGDGYLPKKYITIWNVASGEALSNEPVTNPYIDDFEWNPKNLHEAVYSREIGDAFVFDPLNGTVISTLQIGKLGDQAPGQYEMLALGWSHDGTKLAAAAPYFDENAMSPIRDKDVVVIWDAKSFSVMTKLDNLSVFGSSSSIRWSVDDNYLLVGGASSIQVIDVKAGHIKAAINTLTPIWAFTWSSNDYKIIVCNENPKNGVNINIINLLSFSNTYLQPKRKLG